MALPLALLPRRFFAWPGKALSKAVSMEVLQASVLRLSVAATFCKARLLVAS